MPNELLLWLHHGLCRLTLRIVHIVVLMIDLVQAGERRWMGHLDDRFSIQSLLLLLLLLLDCLLHVLAAHVNAVGVHLGSLHRLALAQPKLGHTSAQSTIIRIVSWGIYLNCYLNCFSAELPLFKLLRKYKY